jgi:ABC-type multidrug transport system ATPase subunit
MALLEVAGMNPVVEVRELSKSYGAIQAIDRVSFDVQPGQAVALLGPNGSGKTTTLRSVAGLLRPDSGTIRVCGADLRRDYRRARQQFSYLPQHASFPANVTAREVAEFHARLRGISGGRAIAALREAGLSELEEGRMVGELSGGMRQRLSLAVAGIAPVPLLLLDEPTANLDPEAALRLRELAHHWRETGRSLLFATHVLTDVEEIADKVVVLVDGKPVAELNVHDLRADLRQFALLRVDVGRPTDAHVSAALACGASRARLNSHAVIITAPVEHRLAILEKLSTMGAVNHFETEQPSLEQIYLEYVKGARGESC